MSSPSCSYRSKRSLTFDNVNVVEEEEASTSTSPKRTKNVSSSSCSDDDLKASSIEDLCPGSDHHQFYLPCDIGIERSSSKRCFA